MVYAVNINLRRNLNEFQRAEVGIEELKKHSSAAAGSHF
jgi:hypothetical protein